jgi:hypothetical protein
VSALAEVPSSRSGYIIGVSTADDTSLAVANSPLVGVATPAAVAVSKEATVLSASPYGAGCDVENGKHLRSYSTSRIVGRPAYCKP